MDADDWVGAFNGDICVGARLWDTSLCGSGVCDVPVMGNNGWPETEGYMNTGDIPTFKIYDASENAYYDAVPSENIPWANFGLNVLDNLLVVVMVLPMVHVIVMAMLKIVLVNVVAVLKWIVMMNVVVT